MEFFVTIKGDFENYEISNLCRVRNKTSGLILKKSFSKNGYIYHSFSNRKLKKHKYLHRLMAEAFIDNPNYKEEVNHINGNKLDNSIENLEWVTRRENQSHYFGNNNKTSQFVGVSYLKNCGKWRAYIRVNRKLLSLGFHKTEIEAYQARVNFEKEHQIDNKYL